MTTHTPRRRGRRQALIADQQREQIIRHFPYWLFGAVVFALMFPYVLNAAVDMTVRAIRGLPAATEDTTQFMVGFTEGVLLNTGDTILLLGEQVIHLLDLPFSASSFNTPSTGDVIAPLFTHEIDHWAADIDRWATEYDLDPNLLATVMQIESCGHPTVSSSAGAQGLFQVMPFHFGSAEDQLDPDTNAMRGASVLNTCLEMANGDPGMAMACYNGGPSVLYQDFNSWLAEPQRYYRWGTGIYTDALQNNPTSPTLDAWLNAGGATLCQMASTELGITP